MPMTALIKAYRAAVERNGVVVARDDRSDTIADIADPIPPCVYTIGFTAMGKPELHITYGPLGVVPDVQAAVTALMDLAEKYRTGDLPPTYELSCTDVRTVTTRELSTPADLLPIAGTIYPDLRAITLILRPADVPCVAP